MRLNRFTAIALDEEAGPLAPGWERTYVRGTVRLAIPTMLVLLWAPSAAAEGSVSLESLLDEMVDRDAAARLPEPSYVLKQVSSHDPRKTNPADPATWHSNNDHDHFIRAEVNQGRREWVVMDASGPGAIVRLWTVPLGIKQQQIIRFYLDGSPTPAMAANFNEFSSGRDFVRPPFAFFAWNATDVRDQSKPGWSARPAAGADLYLPIPFAKRCKITLDSTPVFYSINYRIYPSGTKVRSFTLAGYGAAKPVLDRVAKALLAAPDLAAKAATKTVTLAPQQDVTLALPDGAGAVREVTVRIDPKEAPQALRSLVLTARFDDQPTIWCPIAEFFGAGARLHPLQDWNRSVTADGRLTARWVMPYARSAQLAIKNVGAVALQVNVSAATDAWKWDRRSMLFHANWHAQFGIKTRPRFDWTYVAVQGRGQYVGDTLTVFNSVKAWYGEGDERISIDGERVASHIGTGTEDYYGFGSGLADYFSAPFISQPRRDGAEHESDWQGYATTSRMRLLDAIPFRTALKHDMEVSSEADTVLDYAVATFWYARPGAKHDRVPQPSEAALPLRQSPGVFKIAGGIECEKMPIIAKTADLVAEPQPGGPTVGQWSDGAQLLVRGNQPGDFVELQVAIGQSGPKKITLHATKSWDYGVLLFSINGKAVAGHYDAYSPVAMAGRPIELGVFEPEDGRFILRVAVLGSDPAATGTRSYFGLDAVTLTAP